MATAEETTTTFDDATKELGDKLVKLTLLEAKNLADYLEQEHGIKAAAGGVMVAPGGGGGGDDDNDGPAAQTEFDVILTGAGDAKIQAIKAVRAATNLGLKEAKALVDGAPSPIAEKVSEEEANALKEALEAAGASVEIK